jgi:hypothetical protein
MLSVFKFGLWALIALPFLLAILVLTTAVLGIITRRRLIKFAGNIPCPKCSKVVGRAAALAAQEQFCQKVQEMHQQNPGVMFRMVVEWEIVCPNCGSKFYFYPNTKTIETQSRFAK